MLEEAYIVIRCDVCRDTFNEDLDELGNGAYTSRKVEDRLKEQGWRITSDHRHVCPVCVEDGHPL